MTFSLIVNTGAAGDINTVTTSAIDTTGADLIVIAISDYSGTVGATLSDSKSNTWTPLTGYTFPTENRERLYYCFNPTVGSGHTFTYSGSLTIACVQVQAWSGASSSPFDQENGGINNSSGISTGSVTPSEDNELVVTGMSFDSAATMSIDNGFTISDQVNFGSGNNYGGAMAYKVQTTAAAVNPAWSRDAGTSRNCAAIATFKAAGAPAGGSGMIIGPGPLVGGGMLVGGGPIVHAA